MNTAREEILARIRAALSDVPANESADDVAVPRDYRRRTDPDVDLVALFTTRIEDYRASVHPTTDDALAETVAARLRDRRVHHLVAPADLPATWLAGTDATVTRDDGTLTAADLDRLDGVVTGCAVAIAETGTIVLDAGAAQGRRVLSLVPDYHLCVVRADQIVGTVPEAVARLDAGRPLTWVSGPSATSDIELNRVEGVHGPRTLDVLLAAD